MFYINDLLVKYADCFIKFFAYDVTFSQYTDSAIDQLLEHVVFDSQCEWVERNGMEFFIEKCCYLQIGFRESSFNLLVSK